MQIITKHYVVEDVYGGRLYGRGHITHEVKERNPDLIEYEPNLRCCCFYDIVEVTLDDGEKLVGKPKNYSEWIYFGERLHEGVEEVIRCYSGDVLNAKWHKGLTVEEYKQIYMVEAGKRINLQISEIV